MPSAVYIDLYETSGIAYFKGPIIIYRGVGGGFVGRGGGGVEGGGRGVRIKKGHILVDMWGAPCSAKLGGGTHAPP